jgi:hypothetical protein
MTEQQPTSVYEIPDEHRQRIDAALQSTNKKYDRIEYLSKGANSIIYKLFYNENITIAKVGINSEFKNLHKEFKVLKFIGEIGPHPIVYHADDLTGLQVLIESFIDGYHPFDVTSVPITTYGKTILKYHKLNIPENVLSTETWQKFFETRILQVSSSRDTLSQRFFDAKTQIYSTGCDIEKENPVSEKVLVHGDLIPNNLIVDKHESKIKVIDWEGARLDNAEADLATFIKAFNLSGNRLIEFLEGYEMSINMNILWFRILLHYLQVVAWRLSLQIPNTTNMLKEKALIETESELARIEKMLEKKRFSGLAV